MNIYIFISDDPRVQSGATPHYMLSGLDLFLYYIVSYLVSNLMFSIYRNIFHFCMEKKDS